MNEYSREEFERDQMGQTGTNLSNRVLLWSPEKPTKPGWYWFKSIETEIERIVEVVELSEGLTAQAFDWNVSIQYMDGQWAGPIPQPEER